MKKMTAKLSDEVHTKLKVLSALEGKKMMDIIAEGIEERFQKNLGNKASELLSSKITNRSR